MVKFINIEDYEQLEDLYRDAYYGPIENWEANADGFYDKLLSFNLNQTDREELILKIKQLNLI